MRYRSDDIHPVLWNSVDELTRRIFSGQASSKAVMEHQGVWMKEYGPEVLRQSIAPVLLLFGSVAMAMMRMPKPFIAGAALLAIFWLVAVLCFKTVRNLREITASELETLLPELKFEGVGRAYAEAVLAVGKAQGLSEEMRSETLQELKRVMNEHERIESARSRLILTAEGRASLVEEVERLRGKVEKAQDAEARATYEEGFEIAQARLAATDNQAALGERLEAQAELLRQSVLRVRDTLALPYVETPSEGGALREALAGVRSRAEAVERAVKEVEAW